MVELCRTVRLCLCDSPHEMPANGNDSRSVPAGDDRPLPPRHNAYSAWPPMHGLGRYYEIRVCCAGEPDPVTGYFINIKRIDQAVAGTVLPYLQRLLDTTDSASSIPMGRLVRSMIQMLQEPLGGSVVQLRFHLSPYYCVLIESCDMTRVIIRQQYEFAAAHRLHASDLSDQENRRTFGKCNNPSGHGHNYRLEVAVGAAIDSGGHPVMSVANLDALIDEAVIQKLDHRHLNEDVPQFANLNPTVENITRVIFEMIDNGISQLGVKLEEISVWETDRTVCTYRG